MNENNWKINSLIYQLVTKKIAPGTCGSRKAVYLCIPLNAGRELRRQPKEFFKRLKKGRDNEEERGSGNILKINFKIT